MQKQLNYEIFEKDGLYTLTVGLENGVNVILKEKVSQEDLLEFGKKINFNITKFVTDNNRKLN